MSEQVLTHRTTSPPTPSFNLEKCIEDASSLYKQYSHSPFARTEIAAVLNLSATSGPFRQRLASLKMYNLISSSSSNQFTITEIFERLHFAEKDSHEYKKAAQDAIESASTFKEILHQFSNQLPNIATLARKLETTMGFNHNTAARTAKTLSTSLTEAGLIDLKGNIIPIRDEYSQPVDSHKPTGQQLIEQPLLSQPKILRTEIALKNNIVITIEYPAELSQIDTQKIKAVLDALTT